MLSKCKNNEWIQFLNKKKIAILYSLYLEQNVAFFYNFVKILGCQIKWSRTIIFRPNACAISTKCVLFLDTIMQKLQIIIVEYFLHVVMPNKKQNFINILIFIGWYADWLKNRPTKCSCFQNSLLRISPASICIFFEIRVSGQR